MIVNVSHLHQECNGRPESTSFQLQIERNTTVAEIRAVILRRLQDSIPPADQTSATIAISYVGGFGNERQLLSFQETAQQVGLRNGSNLKVLQPSIVVKVLGGHELRVFNLASTTLDTIKTSIAEKYGIPLAQQIVLFNKAVIKPTLLHLTLFEYGFKDKDSLCILKDKWEVTVCHPQHIWSVQVAVTPQTTMNDIKRQVRELADAVIEGPFYHSNRVTGVTTMSFDRVVSDTCKLIDYEDVSVSDKFSFSYANARVRQENRPGRVSLLQLFLRNLDGNTRVLRELRQTDSVHHVKEMIHQLEGIPVGRQRLSYRGKEMADDKSLMEYAVQTDNHIFLQLRQSVLVEPALWRNYRNLRN